MKIGVYGAGGNGKTAVDRIEIINQQMKKYEEILFIDDVICTDSFYGLHVYSFEKMCENFTSNDIEILISLGDPKARKSVYDKVKDQGYELATIIDPRASVAKSARIGEGSIVCNASIGSDAVIGVNCIISEYAMIGHDVVIGDHCDISANVFIGGHCILGDRVFMAPKAATRDRVNVGDDAVLALSAAVYKDVPTGFIAIGNPARIMKRDLNKGLFG